MHRIDNNDPYHNMDDRTVTALDVSLKALSVHRSDHNLHTYKVYFPAFAKNNYRVTETLSKTTPRLAPIEFHVLQLIIGQIIMKRF